MEICVYCKSTKIVKAGHSRSRLQRYNCKDCKKQFTKNTIPERRIIVNNEKYCSKCKKFKPISRFKIRKNKLQSQCKDCDSKESKARYRSHHITEIEFNNLIIIQENKCSICNNEFKSKRYTFIDHNHKTGKNRSLLCPRCNTLLGLCNEDIKILNNVIEYLIKHN